MTVDWSPFLLTDSLGPARELHPAPSLVGLSTYPKIASADASPSAEDFSSSDAFDGKAYLGDACSNSQDYSLDDWVVPDFFDRPASSITSPVGFAPRNQAVLNATLPAAAAATSQPLDSLWQTRVPFSQPNSFDMYQPTALPFGTIDNNDFSPSHVASPTPSLCGDGSQDSFEPAPISPSISLKRESVSGDIEEPEPKRVARKRGRPRIHRPESSPTNDASSYSDSQKYRSSRRLPHNQVERKYREGLNSELERLRRAVPTLPQRDSSDLTGPPKPSKATVLASAIDYIKFMEAEHERLAEENERLRGIHPAMSTSDRSSRMRLHHAGWSKARASPASAGESLPAQ